MERERAGSGLAQTIYCDESGATGNDLLAPDQPHFVYSAVALHSERAEEIVRRLRSDFNIQSEIKGANLLRHARGRQAISRLLGECAPDVRLVICEKKYALAGKLFEYIFEPVLAKWSRPFYESGFHLFISHLLWVAFEDHPEAAGGILARFQALMRDKGEARLTALLGENIAPNAPRELGQIVTFMAGHRDVISEEVEGLADDDPVGRWVLDLNTSRGRLTKRNIKHVKLLGKPLGTI